MPIITRAKLEERRRSSGGTIDLIESPEGKRQKTDDEAGASSASQSSRKANNAETQEIPKSPTPTAAGAGDAAADKFETAVDEETINTVPQDDSGGGEQQKHDPKLLLEIIKQLKSEKAELEIENDRLRDELRMARGGEQQHLVIDQTQMLFRNDVPRTQDSFQDAEEVAVLSD